MKRTEDVEKKASYALAQAERDELSDLRERVKRLEMEREHSREATARFAQKTAVG